MTAQLQAWVLSEYRLYQRLGPVWTSICPAKDVEEYQIPFDLPPGVHLA